MCGGNQVIEEPLTTTTTVQDTTTTTVQDTTTTTVQDTTTLPSGDVSNPPWDGTIFITGNIITSEDPSTYESQEYKGIDSRPVSYTHLRAHETLR